MSEVPTIVNRIRSIGSSQIFPIKIVTWFPHCLIVFLQQDIASWISFTLSHERENQYEFISSFYIKMNFGCPISLEEENPSSNQDTFRLQWAGLGWAGLRRPIMSGPTQSKTQQDLYVFDVHWSTLFLFPIAYGIPISLYYQRVLIQPSRISAFRRRNNISLLEMSSCNET